jgi:Protein of unknown function (DUF1302)
LLTRERTLPRIVRRAVLGASLSAALAPSAIAFELPEINPDLQMRWDNTFRYNLGGRAQKQNPAILGSANSDDGDRNFGNGSLVINRLDVLSEFDFVYKKNFGARASAALWYDAAYTSLDNTSTATANTLVNGLPVAGLLSPYTKRYANGASGEWLDGFAFANFEAVGVAVNIKAGQHTVYWGESLLGNGAIHGVSYAQNSLDFWKAAATPGLEAKELFRPRGGLTVQAQATTELSVAGQWFYNWQAVRYPESGSYLAGADLLNFGADSLILGPNFVGVPGAPALLRAWNTQAVAPSRYSASLGDWGIATRWSPKWLDGTLGFYYRNATDIQPQILLTEGFRPSMSPAECTAIGGMVVAPGCIINPNATSVADLTQKSKSGTYSTAYGNDIHIMGVSLSKAVGGTSVGAEISYRRNMPLASDPVRVLPAPLVANTPGSIATSAVPAKGTPGALGDTFHALVNALWAAPRTAVFDTANVQAELTFMHWLKVTQNEAVFKGRDNYVGIDKVSRDYVGFAINFTPVWYQAWPGVDLSAPISYARGLIGNAAVAGGGNEGTGSYAFGVSADVFARYRVDLKYTGYFGDYAPNPIGITVFNGASATISDRGWWSLTFKTTF